MRGKLHSIGLGTARLSARGGAITGRPSVHLVYLGHRGCSRVAPDGLICAGKGENLCLKKL